MNFSPVSRAEILARLSGQIFLTRSMSRRSVTWNDFKLRFIPIYLVSQNFVLHEMWMKKKHFPQVFPPNFKAGIAPGLKFAFKQQPKFMPVLRLVHCNSSLRLLLSVGIKKFGQESGSAFAKPFSLITIWFSLFRFRVYSHWAGKLFSPL